MEGDRIKLVPYGKQNIDDVYIWLNDPDVMHTFSGYYEYKSKEQLEKEYEQYLQDDSKMIWIIVVKGVHKTTNIGNIWLQRISPRNRSAEFGILIGKSNWGKGYGKESLRLLINYVFNVMSCKRLFSSALDYNRRATRLYKSIGMIYEGKYRAGAYIGGRYCDMYLYSILRHEWVKRKKSWIPWKSRKSDE